MQFMMVCLISAFALRVQVEPAAAEPAAAAAAADDDDNDDDVMLLLPDLLCVLSCCCCCWTAQLRQCDDARYQRLRALMNTK
jgi:hypothetical protein